MKYLALFILLLSPLTVFGAGEDYCFTATGFGNANANGEYEFYDMSGGSSNGSMPQRYANSTGFYVYTRSDEGPPLMDSTLGSGGADYYRTGMAGYPTFTYTDVVGAWILNAGTAPAGTISESTCGGDPVSTTSSTTFGGSSLGNVSLTKSSVIDL